jgi:hypothetical protein
MESEAEAVPLMPLARCEMRWAITHQHHLGLGSREDVRGICFGRPVGGSKVIFFTLKLCAQSAKTKESYHVNGMHFSIPYQLPPKITV